MSLSFIVLLQTLQWSAKIDSEKAPAGGPTQRNVLLPNVWLIAPHPPLQALFFALPDLGWVGGCRGLLRLPPLFPAYFSNLSILFFPSFLSKFVEKNVCCFFLFLRGFACFLVLKSCSGFVFFFPLVFDQPPGKKLLENFIYRILSI